MIDILATALLVAIAAAAALALIDSALRWWSTLRAIVGDKP